MLLSPGEGVRVPGPQCGQADGGERRIDAEHDFGTRHPKILQREGDFLFDRGGDQLRGRILQHQCHAGRLLVDRMVQGVLSPHEQPAVEATAEELRHSAVQGETEGGFTRTRRTRQSHDFTGLEVKVDIQQRRPLQFWILVGDLTEGDERDRHPCSVVFPSSARRVASRATWSAVPR